MIGFKSIVEQGWFAKKHSNVSIDECPYPVHSLSAKDWKIGWDKADKGEPWSQPRRKVKVEE